MKSVKVQPLAYKFQGIATICVNRNEMNK